MANAKITELAADTSPTADDLVPTVNDPAGTPANKKVTIGALVALAGLVLLESHTASSSATLDFTARNATGVSGATIQTDFDEYEIHFVNLVPATANADFWMRMSTDGGGTYDSGTGTTGNPHYSAARLAWRAAATGIGGEENSATKLVVTTGISTAAGWTLDGKLTLANPGGANMKTVYGQTRFLDNASSFRIGLDVHGAYTNTAAVNAFRFLMSSGNIASGTIRCYGVKK